MFDMKRALRVGGYADLNIITTAMLDDVVGYGTHSLRQTCLRPRCPDHWPA